MEEGDGEGWSEVNTNRERNCSKSTPLNSQNAMQQSVRWADLNPPPRSRAFHLPAAAPVALGVTQRFAATEGSAHAVPYTPLTLPTNREVVTSLVAVSLKKQKKSNRSPTSSLKSVIMHEIAIV